MRVFLRGKLEEVAGIQNTLNPMQYLRTFVSLAWTLLACGTASAEFEKWTDVEGRVVEMEILTAPGEGDAAEVVFRLRSGKQTTVPVSRLNAASQLRVAVWRKRQPHLTAKFVRIQTEKDLGSEPQPFRRQGNPGGGRQFDPKPQPYLSFGFTIRGENIVGIDPQEPTVTAIKVGDGRTFKWQKMVAFPARKPSQVSFGIKGYGDYNPGDLKTAEFSGAVTVLTSLGSRVLENQLRLPSKPGEKVSQKAGSHTIVAEWNATEDPFAPGRSKSIWVSATGSHLLEVIETSVEVDGVTIGQQVPMAHAGKTAVVKIKFWDNLREVPVSLSKKADDPGLLIVTEDDI